MYVVDKMYFVVGSRFASSLHSVGLVSLFGILDVYGVVGNWLTKNLVRLVLLTKIVFIGKYFVDRKNLVGLVLLTEILFIGMCFIDRFYN